MDAVDRQLLNILQQDFPLVSRPFLTLAWKLGLSEGEVIDRIASLKDRGFIRRIGAVFEPQRLGYTSTLCALKVPPDRIEEVARLVNSYPGVTHNYLREDEYNMWFTLIGPTRENIEGIIREIEGKTGLAVMELPALKCFKIRVHFDFN